MKLKKIFSPIFDPYVGPVFVISIVLSFIVFVVIPKHSYENKIEDMTNDAVKTLNYLKKIRIYYTSNVVDKIRYNTTIDIDYDHKESYLTIPLAATMMHDLSLILPEDGMEIKIYSDYPYPNRKDRRLDKFEKDSLAYLVNNPDDVYKKDVVIDNKRTFRLAVADVFLDNTCVECHNNRADSPKKDWKIGDVRGVVEISIPFESGVLLTPKELNILMYIFSIVILLLGVHYTIISIKRTKEHKRVKVELENEVNQRTATLNNTIKLLNQYKKAVDTSAIVSKTDKNGIITYVNDEFIKISKFKKEELLGKSHNIIRHEDMPKDIFKNLWKTIKAKKIWKGEVKNKAKDGTPYYVNTTIVPILDYNNNIEEFLAIRLNITDIVESKQKAQKADAAKSIFLANMSHEIRTPLNAIIGFSEVLRNSHKIDIQSKKQSNIIHSSANSLLAIINDILDISKIESGNFEISKEETDIFYICEHVVELFSKKANEKDIKLIFNIDQKIPLCLITDGVRIRQVLSNFLSNAIKFTPKQGVVNFNVNVESTNESKIKLKVSIEDTGIGIPKEKLERIFDPFIQVDHKSNREFEGTGLGLSISKYIIEALGSKIEIESEVGKGTKFSFILESKICEKEFDENDSYTNGLNFLVLNKEEDSFHYIKRYLNIFGQIDKKDDADILVCDYKKNNLDEIRQEYKQIPKLILFEYEKDMLEFEFNDNENGLSLPFYASKVNDSLQDLLRKSNNSRQQIKVDSDDTFSGKILVAEDNLANQELITYILNDMGIEFDIKENGKEAYEAFKNSSYDLVLMDINMPIMDGIEAFIKIREYEKLEVINSTPIIALTANAIKGDKERFLKLGMSGYLSKPINTFELKDVFKKYLSVNTKMKQEAKEKTTDISKIAQKLGVSENIADLIFNKFKNEIQKDLDELEKYILDEDEEDIVQKAHYIKNSSLNVALDEVSEYLTKLETQKLNKDEKIEIFTIISKEINKAIN
ncbi:ATP-binding protein [Campylobacterota bacterium DY0563]